MIIWVTSIDIGRFTKLILWEQKRTPLTKNPLQINNTKDRPTANFKMLSYPSNSSIFKTKPNQPKNLNKF